MTELLFMAGSAGRNSWNKKLAKHACDIALSKGANAEFIDLKDFEMPLYCTEWELENGIPDATKNLKKKFQNCKGFLMTSPEYNGTFTPLIKNTIDWMSRPHEEDEPILSAYKGKIGAICSFSPGAMGGIRGLTPLRVLLSDIGVHVIPTQLAVGGRNSLDESGRLTNETHIKMMDRMIEELIKTANGLNA